MCGSTGEVYFSKEKVKGLSKFLLQPVVLIKVIKTQSLGIFNNIPVVHVVGSNLSAFAGEYLSKYFGPECGL
jgi:hypothetical protein